MVTKALPPIAAARTPTSSHGRPEGTSELGRGTGVEVGVSMGVGMREGMLVGVLVGVPVGVLVDVGVMVGMGVGVGVKVDVGVGKLSSPSPTGERPGVALGLAFSTGGGVGERGGGAVLALAGASSTSISGAPPIRQPPAQSAPGRSRK